jgi:hypothetical protein
MFDVKSVESRPALHHCDYMIALGQRHSTKQPEWSLYSHIMKDPQLISIES